MAKNGDLIANNNGNNLPNILACVAQALEENGRAPPPLTHARIAVRTVPNCNFKRIAYTPRLCVSACYHWDWLYNTVDTRVIYTPLLERIVITLANCAILMRSTRQSLARPLHSCLAPDHGLAMTKPDS